MYMLYYPPIYINIYIYIYAHLTCRAGSNRRWLLNKAFAPLMRKSSPRPVQEQLDPWELVSQGLPWVGHEAGRTAASQLADSPASRLDNIDHNLADRGPDRKRKRDEIDETLTDRQPVRKLSPHDKIVKTLADSKPASSRLADPTRPPKINNLADTSSGESGRLPSAREYLTKSGFTSLEVQKYAKLLLELQQGEVRLDVSHLPRLQLGSGAETLWHGSECQNLPAIMASGFKTAPGSGGIVAAYYTDRKECGYRYPMHVDGGQFYFSGQRTGHRMLIEVLAHKWSAKWHKRGKNENRQWAWVNPHEHVQPIAVIFKAWA
jgi:hypothetical protein